MLFKTNDKVTLKNRPSVEGYITGLLMSKDGKVQRYVVNYIDSKLTPGYDVYDEHELEVVKVSSPSKLKTPSKFSKAYDVPNEHINNVPVEKPTQHCNCGALKTWKDCNRSFHSEWCSLLNVE